MNNTTPTLGGFPIGQQYGETMYKLPSGAEVRCTHTHNGIEVFVYYQGKHYHYEEKSTSGSFMVNVFEASRKDELLNLVSALALTQETNNTAKWLKEH